MELGLPLDRNDHRRLAVFFRRDEVAHPQADQVAHVDLCSRELYTELYQAAR